jgi:hypothetical protein
LYHPQVLSIISSFRFDAPIRFGGNRRIPRHFVSINGHCTSQINVAPINNLYVVAFADPPQRHKSRISEVTGMGRSFSGTYRDQELDLSLFRGTTGIGVFCTLSHHGHINPMFLVPLVCAQLLCAPSFCRIWLRVSSIYSLPQTGHWFRRLAANYRANDVARTSSVLSYLRRTSPRSERSRDNLEARNTAPAAPGTLHRRTHVHWAKCNAHDGARKGRESASAGSFRDPATN